MHSSPRWRQRLIRTLTTLGDLRPGEGHTASLMFAAVFSVMCAYYMVKPLREGWVAISPIAGLSRMEIKAYSSLAQSLLLLATAGAYARLAARCSRQTLMTGTSLACAVSLLVFWLLQPGFLLDALPGIGIVFYLWVGIFGVFIVAQFWAFATDLYSDDRGRRLLPLVAIGGTAGAAAGSWLQTCLTGLGSAHAVLLLAGLPLLAAMALARAAVGSVRAPATTRHSRPNLRSIMSDRFVMAAGLLALLLSWATTNGENLLFQVVQEGVARASAVPGVDVALAREHVRAATSAFYGDFYLWTNVAALAAQLLLTSRLLKRGGLAAVIFILPMLALLASALVALAPVLAVLKWVKVAEQATDYSLNQTARQILWLPASAEIKYEIKPTIDALFVRVGDGLAALTVLASNALVGNSTTLLVVVNLVLVACWLVTAMVLVHEHGRLVAARSTESAARRDASPWQRARRALVRVTRRARHAVRRVRWIDPTPWNELGTRLALVPIGRGDPPPAWQVA